MDIIAEFEKVFKDSIKPLKLSIYTNDGSNSQFHCRVSTSPNHKADSTTSLYNLPSLLRPLIQQAGIMSEDLLDDYYNQGKQQELCYILEWSDRSRKVFIFDLNDIERFNQSEFTKIIEQNQPLLIQLFNKIKS